MRTSPRLAEPRAPEPGRLAVLALVAGALVLGVVAWLAGWRVGADSAVYRAGALTFLRGDELYTHARLAALPEGVALPFTYPPAAVLVFLPLAALPAGLVWAAVTAASVLALVVAVRVSARSVRPGIGWLPVVALALLALGLEPVWKTLFLGQVNLLLMAAVLVDVLVVCARGSRWGGVLVGIAAAVKLTPLIFVPHLLFTGRRKEALRATVTFVALQAVMFVPAPRDAARYWATAASDPERIGSVHWIFNQSLHGMVSRAADGAPWALWVAVALGAVLAAPAGWLVVRLHRRGESLAAVLVTAFYALLLSPVSWSHHWVWAVPLAAGLLLRGARAWAAAVTVLFASAVVMLVPNGNGVEFSWGPGESVAGNAYVLAVIAVLAVLTARELRKHAPIS
ncbi:glycosyltransferase 87 family protein [Prauserella oleivorans]|uniref:Glycosyltransferase 87 family protein n=1 Tax=Prauserella oleivorans TaxID=1478153 RepID=A0ABW5WCS9_9PSEU